MALLGRSVALDAREADPAHGRGPLHHPPLVVTRLEELGALGKTLALEGRVRARPQQAAVQRPSTWREP
eukprot:8116079-Pyramimonas_sp.AAC.1